MSRQVRTLVIVAVMAILGVSALAWMAGRYREVQPMRSVEDLPDRAPPVPPVPSPEPVEIETAAETAVPADPAVADPAATEPIPGSASNVMTQVDRFISVRESMRSFMDEHRAAMDSFMDEMTGDTAHRDKIKMNLQIMRGLRTVRYSAMRKAEMSAEDYEAARAAYRGWKTGDDGVDEEFVAAFEERRDRLNEVDLGRYEALDTMVAL